MGLNKCSFLVKHIALHDGPSDQTKVLFPHAQSCIVDKAHVGNEHVVRFTSHQGLAIIHQVYFDTTETYFEFMVEKVKPLRITIGNNNKPFKMKFRTSNLGTFSKVFKLSYFKYSRFHKNPYNVLYSQKTVVHDWKGYGDPGCPYGGVLFQEEMNRRPWDWRRALVVPQLMCGSKMKNVYTPDSIPRGIELTDKDLRRKNKYDMAHFYVYTYYPHSYVELTLEVHKENHRDTRKMFNQKTFPCIQLYMYFLEQVKVADPSTYVRQEHVASLNRLPLTYDNNPDAFTSLGYTMESIDFSLTRPCFFGRLHHCKFGIFSPKHPKGCWFTIRYMAPRKPPHVACPGYLKYWKNHMDPHVLLTKSSTTKFRGQSLLIEFDQGCTWYGAAFTVIFKKSDSNQYVMSKNNPTLSSNADLFWAIIPMLAGTYMIDTLRTPRQQMLGNYYKLSFSSDCAYSQPWGDVHIADMYYLISNKGKLKVNIGVPPRGHIDGFPPAQLEIKFVEKKYLGSRKIITEEK